MSNSTNRNRINKHYDRKNPAGIVIDAGPYIGIVKNNVDPSRLGRLEVYIPDLSGQVDGINVPITVTYASPFGGSTKGIPSPDEYFSYEQQTYGFWAVPPDLENQVLVTFVAGDISRGYWFACIPNAESRHMLPGISRLKNDKIIFKGSGLEDRDLNRGNVYLPTSEVNLNSQEKSQRPDMLSLDRIVHQVQAETVIQQGLETDPNRGTITSSSQRESPSRVFGISTPGRPYPDIAKTVESRDVLEEFLKSSTTIADSQINNPQGRSGGHTFVMDDGDVYGDNDLVRLRTAGGHTILMHDTENIIYITNKEGNAWVELAPNGAINVYSAKTMSIRSELDINLHADANVNIQAGDSINFHAEKNIETQSQEKRERIANLHHVDSGRYDLLVGGQMKVKSGTTSGWHVGSGELWMTGSQIHLNTGGKTIATPDHVAPLEQYRKQDVKFDPTTKRWVINPASTLDSIATFTPTHEPWSRETGRLVQNSGTIKPSTKQQDI